MNMLARKAVAAVDAKPAATTLVVRDGPDGLEVLMVRRSPQASFMPGAYVFPGGAVDAADGALAAQLSCDETGVDLARRIGRVTHVGDQALAYSVAALRECFEECGLWLGATREPAAGWAALRARLHAGEALAPVAISIGLRLATRALQPWSHWVTPIGLPKRFDTLFFVVQAPSGQTPTVDAGETTTLAWVHPPAALAAQAQGEFPMEFATVSTVQSLQPFANGTAQALLAYAASLSDLPPLHPRLQVDAEQQIRGVMLPGQPGYEQGWGAPSA